MDDAAGRLSRYFLGQLALNSAFGIVIGVGLWIIGVPSPVLWGIFALLMRFIPYIGAFLSAVLPIALAAAVDPGWSMVVATFLLFALVEPIVGQIIEPLVYGHSTGLSPFSVLVSALFWTWLWGPVGLLLSTRSRSASWCSAAMSTGSNSWTCCSATARLSLGGEFLPAHAGRRS